MKVVLSQRQRIVVALIYLALTWAILALIDRQVTSGYEQAVFWLYSAALMVVLGRYVVEPFFTTPADAIVNGLTMLITLDSLPAADKQLLLGFRWLWYYGIAAMAFGAVAIFLKDARYPFLKIVSRSAYKAAEWGGKAQVIFSMLYWSASYSFFGRPGYTAIFVSMLVLWICATFFDVAGKVVAEVTHFIGWLKRGVRDELGHAIGCDNPLLYKVEVDYSKYRGKDPLYGDIVAIETKPNIGAVGMVVTKKHLLGKSWLSVYLLTSTAGDVITLDLRKKKLTADPKSIFSAANTAFLLDMKDGFEIQETIGNIRGAAQVNGRLVLRRAPRRPAPPHRR